MNDSLRCGILIIICLLAASSAFAGGVDPRDVPMEPVAREKVTATPAETSSAVNKARRAVVPVVEMKPVIKEVPITRPQPKAVSPVMVDKDSWLLSTSSGTCEPLSAVSKKVSVGAFSTPEEFARKMQQRGYQAFALDIGDVRDQVIRVKVPDKNLDLTFKKAGLCR